MASMQIGFHLTNLYRFVRINPTNNEAQSSFAAPVAAREDITQQSLNNRRVAHIDATLSELDELLTRAQVRSSAGIATALSRSPLGLSMAGTQTRLASTDEVNVATTSYTPFGPVFAGSGLSTALPEITGVYDGSNGDDLLEFKVTRTGVRGQSRIDVRVYDSEGDELDYFRIRRGHPLDREYQLSNGLIFTLGSGTLVKDDVFYMNVYQDTPSFADPDKPFDGTHDDRPNFDHDVSVTSGSFDLNGVTIAVNASDTINTVLDRIENSAAEVDAVYDSGSDSILLTHRSIGSQHDIVLANDTSGFVAATKLTGSATPGLDRDIDRAMGSVARFAAVNTGSITINGNGISIDPTTDSLSDLIDRINSANVGVTASLIHDGQRLLLKSNTAGASLSVDDNGTGLLDALGIAEKTYRARTRNGFARAQSYQIADRVERTAGLINEIFDPGNNPTRDALALTDLRSGIVAALRGTAPDGDSGLGVRFSLDAPVRRNFITVDRGALTGHQQRNVAAISQFLHGMIASLRGVVSSYQADYGDSSGTFIEKII